MDEFLAALTSVSRAVKTHLEGRLLSHGMQGNSSSSRASGEKMGKLRVNCRSILVLRHQP
jgi:hypothetical protein